MDGVRLARRGPRRERRIAISDAPKPKQARPRKPKQPREPRQPEPPEQPEVADEEPSEEKSEEHGALRFLKELPVLIVLALVIALLIKTFVVQAFYIEMQSMEPTLHPSERVLVSKFHYRFGDPHRGDIVIFEDPRARCAEDGAEGCDRGFVRGVLDWVAGLFGLPTANKEDLVKRIVALPGETIAMHDGDIYVCDDPGCKPLDKSGKPDDGRLITFPRDEKEGPQKDDADLSAFTVPKDEYYVLGDNRAQSSDSRVFGAVPRKQFVGKAFVLIWPIGRFQGL